VAKRRTWGAKLLLPVLSLLLIVPLLSACGGGTSSSAPPESYSTVAVTATAETEIYNNGNLSGVENNPTYDTTFDIIDSYQVTLITDYHWNNGQGAKGGTIGLEDSDGNVVGTWPVTVRNGVYWDVHPNTVIDPGEYTVVDSDPSTWAQNLESDNSGITDIKGYIITYVVSKNTTNPATGNTPSTTQSAGPKNTQPAMDVTADKASATVGQSGGELDLKNGAKLVIPAGALSAGANLQLNQVSNPVDFGADTTAYDITGLNPATGAVTLNFPVTKGLAANLVSICTYNTTSQQESAIPYNYNATGGTVAVTIDPNKISFESIKPKISLPVVASLLGPLYKLIHPDYSITERLRILFTPETAYTAASGNYVIPTPFYEQSGGSCWATDTLMLLRTYDTGNMIQRNLGEPLYGCNEAGVSIKDFGLDAYGFETALASYISGQTGATVTWRGYYNMDNLRYEMLRQLDNSHPMIIHLPGIGHYALVIGYRDSGNTLIIQDSNGVAPSTAQPNLAGMYSVRTFDWIRSMEGGINNLGGADGSLVPVPLQILWVDKAANFPGTLQTIDMPGADETFGCSYGGIDFYGINPKVKVNNKVTSGYLQFDPSQLTGYSWFNMTHTPINTIPNTASNLELMMPVFNSARIAATVTEKTFIRSGTTPLDTEKQDVSLPAAQDNTTARVDVNQDITLDKIVNPALADANGVEPLSIDVTLNQGDNVVDRFEIDANLSIIPNISSLTTATIVPGSQLGIYGNNFGDTQLSKSKVTITGKQVDIVDWMPDEVIVNVPSDLDTMQPGVTYTGPESVVVYTGDKFQYQSTAFTVAAPTSTAKYYKLVCTIDPAQAASAGAYAELTGSGQAGKNVAVDVSIPSGFSFIGFTGGDDLNLTTADSQTFVMPAHDVILVAHFKALPPQTSH
jgi:hypothetical protein